MQRALPARGAIRAIQSELYLCSDAMLGEGPVWDKGTLYWTDITGKRLFVKSDSAASAAQYEVGTEVGAFALCDDEGMALATAQGFQGFNLKTKQLTPWVNPEAEFPDNRFNDGKCDPCGRFVAGTMHRPEAAAQGALYVLDHDRSARKICAPVTCSNGLVWSESGTTFYYIDTPTAVVRAFCYELETGTLGDERVVIEIPAAHGKPDGMTIDRDGNLWIALWEGWGVECWSPVSGKRLARIEVPALRVTSCVFGGARFDTMFITTARIGLDKRELARQDKAGSIFCAKPGVSGYAAVRFRRKGRRYSGSSCPAAPGQ
jgi:sugar lactone lactonase YvrE